MRNKIVIFGVLAAAICLCLWMPLRLETSQRFPSLRIVEASTKKPERAVWLVISNVSNRVIYFKPDSCIRVSFRTNEIWQTDSPDYNFNNDFVIPPGFASRIGAQLPENAVAAKFSLKCQMLSWAPNLLLTIGLTIGNNHFLGLVEPFTTSFEGITIPTEWSDVYVFNSATNAANSLKDVATNGITNVTYMKVNVK
jgi:hypothetical protein